MVNVRTALFWSLTERYAGLIINLASTMVLARLLTPAQVGVFSLCASLAAVAGILRDFGVSEYLVQERHMTTDKLRAAFGVAILVAWSIGAMILLGRGALAHFYREPGVASVLAVLSLNFLMLPFASPAFAMLTREMAFRKIFFMQITSNTTQAVTAVLLAWHGFGYMSLAWAPVSGIAMQTVLTTLMRPRDSLVLPGWAQARQVLRYGSMFVVSRVIETLTRNAHEFLIARQTGFAAVGLFSRAFGLIELFNSNVTQAVQRVASPVFASQHRSGQALAVSFARSTAIFTSLAFPFCGFIALMAGDIILVLFGRQWLAAAPVARLLAVGLVPFYLVGLAPTLLAATGHIQRRLRITLGYAPVHLVGVFCASFFGLQAVAAVWVLSYSVMMLMYMAQLRTVLQASVGELFKPSVASAAVALLSLAGQALMLAACRYADLPALPTLVAVTLAGATAWLGATRLLHHPVYGELITLLRHRRAI